MSVRDRGQGKPFREISADVVLVMATSTDGGWVCSMLQVITSIHMISADKPPMAPDIGDVRWTLGLLIQQHRLNNELIQAIISPHGCDIGAMLHRRRHVKSASIICCNRCNVAVGCLQCPFWGNSGKNFLIPYVTLQPAASITLCVVHLLYLRLLLFHSDISYFKPMYIKVSLQYGDPTGR